MTFTNAVIEILESKDRPLTPQEIRDIIKKFYPHFYGTLSHKANVDKGHYKDLDHALLAQIYSLIRQNNSFLKTNESIYSKYTFKTQS